MRVTMADGGPIEPFRSVTPATAPDFKAALASATTQSSSRGVAALIPPPKPVPLAASDKQQLLALYNRLLDAEQAVADRNQPHNAGIRQDLRDDVTTAQDNLRTALSQQIAKALPGNAAAPNAVSTQANSIKALVPNAKPSTNPDAPSFSDVVDQASADVQKQLDSTFPPALRTAINNGDWKSVTAIAQKQMGGGPGSTPASIYANATALADLAPNSADCQNAIQAAFANLVVTPAAAAIAKAYQTGGATGGAAALRQAVTGEPPEVAQMIFTAAGPTVDAIATELGKLANSQGRLPTFPLTADQGLPHSHADFPPANFPQLLPNPSGTIETQEDYNNAFSDLSASVDLASRGPSPTAGQQVTADIVAGMKSGGAYNTSSDGMLNSAVTQSVGQGDGAVLPLAITQALLQGGQKPKATSVANATAAGVTQLQKNTDTALQTYLNGPPKMQQMLYRWGPYASSPDQLAAARQKFNGQNPDLQPQYNDEQAAFDKNGAALAYTLNDLKTNPTSTQGLDANNKLTAAWNALTADKSVRTTIGLSKAAQQAVVNTTLSTIGQSSLVKGTTPPPNLLWASRIARGLAVYYTAKALGLKPTPDANFAAIQKNFLTLPPDEQASLLANLGTDAKTLPSSLAEIPPDMQTQLLQTTGSNDFVSPRGGIPLTTPAGMASAGFASFLYVVGAINLLGTTTPKGGDPVTTLLNQSFGAYILWGAANNSYLLASGVAQSVAGSSAPAWADPALLKSPLFEASVTGFDVGASILLSGIIGPYFAAHGDYTKASLYEVAGLAGAAPIVAQTQLGVTLGLGAATDLGTIEAASWVDPVSGLIVLGATGALYGVSLYRRVQASNQYEGPNQQFLQDMGIASGDAKQLANDDANGNSVGPVFQAVANKLGISDVAMRNYLASFKDPQQLKDLVLAAQGVKPNDNGDYPVDFQGGRDAVPEASAGSTPAQLKAYYEKYSQDFAKRPGGGGRFALPETVTPPAGANDQYYRSMFAYNEGSTSVDGLIQWAKDNGMAFPTAPPPKASPPPVVSPPPPPAPTTRQVVAVPGDTLFGIAQKNGTNLPTIEPLNPQFDWTLLNGNPFTPPPPPGQRDPDLIYSGDKVTVPIQSAPNPPHRFGGRMEE